MILDLDGTVHLDGKVFPSTLPFLDAIRELGIGHTFMTNRCSSSTTEYEAKLRSMGIEIETGDVYTSGGATIDFIRAAHPDVRRVFVLGTSALQDEFCDAGFQIARDEPDAVVVGFDMTLTFDGLCHAAYLVKSGLPYLATHPDVVCPTGEPTVLVDCGAVCAAIEASTGRAPDAVLGKPNVAIVERLLDRLDLEPSQVAMVGDRIYTDMRMGREAQLMSVLVLSGEATEADAEKDAALIDLVVDDLGALGRLLREAKV